MPCPDDFSVLEGANQCISALLVRIVASFDISVLLRKVNLELYDTVFIDDSLSLRIGFQGYQSFGGLPDDFNIVRFKVGLLVLQIMSVRNQALFTIPFHGDNQVLNDLASVVRYDVAVCRSFTSLAHHNQFVQIARSDDEAASSLSAQVFANGGNGNSRAVGFLCYGKPVTALIADFPTIVVCRFHH